MYSGNKAQACEIYNLIGKLTTPIIKLIAAAVDYPVTVCTKTAVRATKPFEQISLEVVFRITDISTTCFQVNVATDNYFSTLLNTDTRDIRGVRHNFPFTERLYF